MKAVTISKNGGPEVLELKDIKLPDHCGMYKIMPVEIEIWKEGEFRRHERTLFKSEGKKWAKSYLSP